MIAPVCRRTYKIWLTLLLSLSIAGCISNSAKFDLSPCAGCDFEPVDTLSRQG